MLLDLFDWLAGYYGGFRVFGYLTLRAILAALTALSIALLVGPWMIRKLAERQIGQVVRDYGPPVVRKTKEDPPAHAAQSG